MKLTRSLLKEFILAELNGADMPVDSMGMQTTQEKPKPTPEEIEKQRIDLKNKIIAKEAEIATADLAVKKLVNLRNELQELIKQQNELGR